MLLVPPGINEAAQQSSAQGPHVSSRPSQFGRLATPSEFSRASQSSVPRIHSTKENRGIEAFSIPRSVVARGRNAGCIPRFHWGLSGGWSREPATPRALRDYPAATRAPTLIRKVFRASRAG